MSKTTQYVLIASAVAAGVFIFLMLRERKKMGAPPIAVPILDSSGVAIPGT